MYLNTEVQPVHAIDYSPGSCEEWDVVGVYQFDAMGKLEVPLHVNNAGLHLRLVCAPAPAQCVSEMHAHTATVGDAGQCIRGMLTQPLYCC